MGFGVSLILIAGGAILAWAVHRSPSGVDVNTIGVILLVIGIIGLVLSMMYWSTWWGPGYFRRRYVAGGPRRAVRRPYADPDYAPSAPGYGGRYEEVVEEEQY